MSDIHEDSAPAPAPAAALAAAPAEPRQVLQHLLQLMDFQAVEVRQTEEEERTLLDVSGEEAALLIGKKGQTLDALQFIVNKIAGREGTDRRPVVIDSGGYRQRRIDSLTQLAQRLGEKAQREGKIVAVNPMSAHDRRIIHMALRETPGVSTRSEGEGSERRLLIVPDP